MVDNQKLNRKSVDIIKEFAVKKIILLLESPDAAQQIKEDVETLEKLGIQLEPKDLTSLIAAIKKSTYIDNENSQIKDGQTMKNYFSILENLFSETNMLDFYNKFSKIKLDQFRFSDFHYILTALKTFDYTNWSDNSLNVETLVAVKDYYFNTILNSNLQGEDKIYNLNVLQDDLKIALSEEEKGELSNHLKLNIMKLVDLIDHMRKTSFGAKPLPVSHRSPKPVDKEVKQTSSVSDKQPPSNIDNDEDNSPDPIESMTKKKSRHGLFHRE